MSCLLKHVVLMGPHLVGHELIFQLDPLLLDMVLHAHHLLLALENIVGQAQRSKLMNSLVRLLQPRKMRILMDNWSVMYCSSG